MARTGGDSHLPCPERLGPGCRLSKASGGSFCAPALCCPAFPLLLHSPHRWLRPDCSMALRGAGTFLTGTKGPEVDRDVPDRPQRPLGGGRDIPDRPQRPQCTVMPSNYIGAEPICIYGVTGGSQKFTVLEDEASLTGNKWQKQRIVTGPDAPCILHVDYVRRGYFKDPKWYRWAFGIAALETEDTKQLSTLPSLWEDPSVGLLSVKEQQVPIATTAVHRQQYGTNRDPPFSSIS